MHNKVKVWATIRYIIVAFLFSLAILLIIQIGFEEKLNKAITLINLVSVNDKEKTVTEMKLNSNVKRLESYPEYGAKYGTIEIPSIDVDLPLYYGDSLSVLRKGGVGQSSGGYFPGEGGSIICMAHNTKGYLYRLSEVQIGDTIKITTTYGEFNYEIYDTKIVPQTDLDAVPVQDEEEILMIYTCYPTNSIGHATKRFIAYAKLV